MAVKGLRNLEVKVPIDRSQRRRGQTMDFNKERCLSNLCNKNSSSKMELV